MSYRAYGRKGKIMGILAWILIVPVALIVITLLVLALVTSIKKTRLNNKIKNTIYAELVARAPEKSTKELAEYMKIIKKS